MFALAGCWALCSLSHTPLCCCKYLLLQQTYVYLTENRLQRKLCLLQLDYLCYSLLLKNECFVSVPQREPIMIILSLVFLLLFSASVALCHSHFRVILIYPGLDFGAAP